VKKSHIDLATDYIGKVLGDVQNFVKEENKNVQPYQSVKVPDEEIVARYINMSPENKQMAQTQFPEAWGKYEANVQNIIARRQKNG